MSIIHRTTLYSSLLTAALSLALYFLLISKPSAFQSAKLVEKIPLYSLTQSRNMSETHKTQPSRLRPIYFVSHGGPTFMYRDDDFGDAGAWDTVTDVGKEILNDPPEALVVISAHWQETSSSSGFPKSLNHGFSSRGSVGITCTDSTNPLIYDFYNFPKYMYQEEFHTKGSTALAKSIAELLTQPQTLPDGTTSNGFDVNMHESRGIDHGVWVPLRVAFPQYSLKQSVNGSDKNADFIPFPVIQVSLPSTPSNMQSHRSADISFDTRASFALGQALRELRDRQTRNIAIVCSGMSFHNLRDLFDPSFYRPLTPEAYAQSFERQLSDVVEKSSKYLNLNNFSPPDSSSEPGSDGNSNSLTDITNLFKAPGARRAHPTLEHIMPMAVALGANTVFTPAGSTFDESLVEKTGNKNSGQEGDFIGPIDFSTKQLYGKPLMSLAWGTWKFGV